MTWDIPLQLPINTNSNSSHDYFNTVSVCSVCIREFLNALQRRFACLHLCNEVICLTFLRYVTAHFDSSSDKYFGFLFPNRSLAQVKTKLVLVTTNDLSEPWSASWRSRCNSSNVWLSSANLRWTRSLHLLIPSASYFFSAAPEP